MKKLLYELFYFIFDKKLETLTPQELLTLIQNIEDSGLNLEMKKELLDYGRLCADKLHRDNRNTAQKFFKIWGDLRDRVDQIEN